MNIKFKIAIWEEIQVDEDFREVIMEDIAKGKITSSKDLYALYPKACIHNEYLVDDETQLTQDQNNGEPTIEIE